MAYTIEKLPDEAIVVFSGGADFIPDEGPQMMDDMLAVLDAQPENVYFVSNLGGLQLNVDHVVEGSSLMTRGPKAVFHHPRIIENIFVTSSGFLKLAAQGLSAPLFGGLQVKIVDSLDEALDYCRQKLAVG